ncbi:MAG: hypothetical protein KDD37_02080 [Bdellovibrionales bacterium]|nr:hypothetical protein [Bdellovibrionales bacterium]
MKLPMILLIIGFSLTAAAQDVEVIVKDEATVIFKDTETEATNDIPASPTDEEINQEADKKLCQDAVTQYELQFHLQVQAKVNMDKAEADLNNPNPIYFFSRGSNARAVRANKAQFNEAVKNIEDALGIIYTKCGPNAIDYIKEVDASVLKFFNKTDD